MILLPAIDILGGRAVRLAQGSFQSPTVYDADPLDAARRWVQAGARGLHLVDLDGARDGSPANFDHVARIASDVEVPVQVGGGMRTIGAIEEAVAAGVSKVVLGTAAYRDLDLLDEAVSRLGERLVVSVDARNGRIAAAGWTEEHDVPVAEVFTLLGNHGVRRFVYSSIERDGMLSGPDLDAVHSVAQAVRGSFLYSGGVSSTEDLRRLGALREVNLIGVIVGKALYEQRFTVEQGQRALEEGLCTTSG